MDFCTCTVTLGGDSRSQVQIPPRKAVSYAEVLLMRVVHGGMETVRDVQVIDSRDHNPVAEKSYLMSKYDPEIVNELYPGISPTMPESAVDDPYLAASPAPVPASEPAPEPTPAKKSRKGAADDAGDGFPA